ncbi:pentapeptide repeat-containing protein [Conexibacter sp. CPCC 206217]|uniref:pentapeptide repeat-containing protein n=1 Tax=Conexibacter sp. CPCC 206217 TaxID=3064574 RepID=UPI002717FACE|nr:pentapeptide repeat-containing protein [Conexibacter sp. CPCC 206217]MDO8213704.1 pentapeptide repeat-containing protein [Conexibacter sp. CPCC 206217]
MASSPRPPRAPRKPHAEIDLDALDDKELEAEGLRDVVLDNANLANRRGVRVLVERARLHGCRMTGIQLAESTLRDVVIEDSRVDLAAFRVSRFERVVFRRCQLQELDLVEAELSSVVFDDCDLSGADFSHARFRLSEMRGCTLDAIVGAERLRGVAMPWTDVVGLAGTLAAAIGIGVLENDQED